MTLKKKSSSILKRTLKKRSRSKRQPHILFIPIIDAKLYSKSPSRIRETAWTLAEKKNGRGKNKKKLKWWFNTLRSRRMKARRRHMGVGKGTRWIQRQTLNYRNRRNNWKSRKRWSLGGLLLLGIENIMVVDRDDLRWW